MRLHHICTLHWFNFGIGRQDKGRYLVTLFGRSFILTFNG
jgi:hypothetical protein